VRFEYLLFDALVLLPPLLTGLLVRSPLRRRLPTLFKAVLLVALPFVAWDAAVEGRHWWFNPRFISGLKLFGLPVEEVLFFIAVPFACVFLWETAFHGEKARPRWSWVQYAVLGCALLSGFAWAVGKEYTAFALGALSLSALLDLALGTGLYASPRFWALQVAVAGLGFVFNGYLTSRPVVEYGPEYFLGVRIWTVPLEDFFYGAALVGSVTVVYHHLLDRVPSRSFLEWLVLKGLGGSYVVAFHTPDTSLPDKLPQPRTVAVIGAGLAGITAAVRLGQRGFRVALFDKNEYLGGKVGSWRETLKDGFNAQVDHGFHAFFRHYYNLNAFLEEAGVRPHLKSVGQYQIRTQDGRSLAFDEGRSVPALNLLALAKRGLYRLRDVAFGPAGKELEAFLRYDRAQTFSGYDQVSFEEFAQRARLPKDLRTVFTTFARAFFAEDHELSAAELIKSFHFYYLSHDRGLVYDHLDGRYDEVLLTPLERFLQASGAAIRLGQATQSVRRGAQGGFEVDGEPFDHVVIACDVEAARRLALPLAETEKPELARQLKAMHAGRRYAVLRLWLDVPSGEGHAVFVSTERTGELDSVTFVHRTDPECAAWAKAQGGSVLELHSYAVSDASPDDAAVRSGLLDGLHHHFPELRRARIVHEHLQVRRDFTALHVGMANDRPGVETGIPGLCLAGDWVALPAPAMLMEAACLSGALAANVLCAQRGVQSHAIHTVPLRGMLSRVPRRR